MHKNVEQDKEYKQLKKELKKQAKEFRPFDYGYNLQLFVTSLKLTLFMFERPDSLYQDTNDIKYKKSLESLQRAVSVGEQLVNGVNTWKEETQLIDEFFTIVKDYIQYWWD